MRLSRFVAAALIAVIVASVAVSASLTETWTCRSINLRTGDKFWHDAEHMANRQTLQAASYAPCTTAAVTQGPSVSYWQVMAVSGPGGSVLMWVRDTPPAAVPLFDADAFAVGDVVVIDEP